MRTKHGKTSAMLSLIISTLSLRFSPSPSLSILFFSSKPPLLFFQLDRSGLLNDAMVLAKEDKLSYTVALSLLKSILEKDLSYLVWDGALTEMYAVGYLLRDKVCYCYCCCVYFVCFNFFFVVQEFIFFILLLLPLVLLCLLRRIHAKNYHQCSLPTLSRCPHRSSQHPSYRLFVEGAIVFCWCSF